MDKEKDTNHAGNLLLPPGRYSVYSPPSSSYGLRPETLGSTIFPPLGSGGDPESGYYGHGLSSDSRQFSHDISRMPDNPPKNMGHRRAHSEILMLPDDISFDSDLGVVGGLNGTSFSDDTEEDLLSMYFDVDKFSSSSATSAFQVGEPYSSAASVSCSPPKPLSSSVVGAGDSLSGVSEKPRIRHQHSLSMDGSTSIKTEMLTSGTEEASSAEAKKAMSSAKLAELALIDPKRAKRIWANRQSAARSKERKMRYIAELERKVQTLQTEATTLSAQLTLMQRDTNGLTAENSELKLRMQTMEQQVRLQDALNDALKEEIQHLKVLSGQIPNGGPHFSPSLNPHYYSGNPMMHTMMTTQQFQQLQINSQKNQQQQFHQNQLHQLQQQQHSQSVVLSQGDIKSRGVSLQSHVVNDGPDMAPSSSKG